jgi:hypothetical protein
VLRGRSLDGGRCCRLAAGYRGAVYKVYKIAKRIDDALGLDKQGRTVTDRLGRIEHQLFPNGGSSLTDKINQIAFEQRAMKGELML